jgi:hypothetical protein
MTKTFCDCCGKEIHDSDRELFDHELIKLGVLNSDISVEVTTDPNAYDICNRCVYSNLIAALQKKIGTENKANQVKITPPPPFSTEGVQWTEFQKNAEKAIFELADELHTHENKLTREQFREAIAQAIKCGDFMRYVQVGHGAQAVVYLPYQREQELESRIKELDTKLRAAMGILDRVQPATIDRDIRSASIENICRDIRLLKEDI